MNPSHPLPHPAPTIGQADSNAVLGIDVGGTKIAAGLLTWPDGGILTRRTIPTQPERGGRAVMDDMLQLARDLASEAAPMAIGLGICELVTSSGSLASGGCIPWLDIPVQQELAAIAPAYLEADVRAAALAESLFGAGRSLDTFLYVSIGTGISCCLMLQGRAWQGVHGFAGTMASSPLTLTCEKCGHTSDRALEQIASGPALSSQFGVENTREVLAAASTGDPRAIKLLHSAGTALGSQIGLLVNVLDPGTIIIGGGLGLSEGRYGETFRAAIREHIWLPTQRALPILAASTGTDAGWLGAAAHAAQAGGLDPASPGLP